MKEITQYKANDGTIFNIKEDCVKYDNISTRVDSILLVLPSHKLEGCRFENGDGYIQHKSDVKKKLSNALVKLANDYFEPTKLFTQFNYYLGRYIDDSNTKCLNKLSYKIMCIDKNNREWGQPYFATNPSKGKDIQLN